MLVTGVAVLLGIFAACGVAVLHPRTRVRMIVAVPLGAVGGLFGMFLFAPLWLPVVDDVDAAARIAGGACGGLVIAVGAVIARPFLTNRRH